MSFSVGTIIAISKDKVIPEFWKECDGSIMSVQEYPLLFSVLGTKFGGDGIHTFILPNFKNYTQSTYIIRVESDFFYF